MGDMVEKETARVKDYMMLINIADSRTMFRIRTKMLELIANMKPTCMERATLHVRLAVHGL